MNFVGEFLSELAQNLVRDGIVAAILKWRQPKKAPPVDRERERIKAKRKLDRRNRRSH